jgi:CRISPR-associated protein Cmr3
MSPHLLKLSPTDVLFFRDGRPMEGASCGHGAAWPLPNVLSSAIHHALRRADLADLHQHRPARNGKILNQNRVTKGREFGSLQVAGPFPVKAGKWLFPRPADADKTQTSATTHRPLGNAIKGAASSLENELLQVVNTYPPSKDKAEQWLDEDAYNEYLRGEHSMDENAPGSGKFFKDADLFTAEQNIGIGIDPETETQNGEQFYSASYLRLTADTQLGLIAHCMDKGTQGIAADNDLIAQTFPNSHHETHILAGGQQRTCTVKRETREKLPLPIGPQIEGKRVRWTLLTPAIFPHLSVSEKNTTEHPGGWLPTWIHPETMKVQLKDPQASVRGSESREGWRERVSALPAINATLVATSIPRAVTVTGWALSDSDDAGNIMPGGARATHLAVPAGAVYYFEASSEEDARKLAAALNWHGVATSVPLEDTVATTVSVVGSQTGRSANSPQARGGGHSIQNRRSSLMGEKGFGLGVCSNWQPHTI